MSLLRLCHRPLGLTRTDFVGQRRFSRPVATLKCAPSSVRSTCDTFSRWTFRPRSHTALTASYRPWPVLLGNQVSNRTNSELEWCSFSTCCGVAWLIILIATSSRRYNCICISCTSMLPRHTPLRLLMYCVYVLYWVSGRFAPAGVK
jgi:hypothetical protein